jgi:hypothetical protein
MYNTVSTICLLMAMVALGLNVAFKDLKNRALKPLMTINADGIVTYVFTKAIMTNPIKKYGMLIRPLLDDSDNYAFPFIRII